MTSMLASARPAARPGARLTSFIPRCAGCAVALALAAALTGHAGSAQADVAPPTPAASMAPSIIAPPTNLGAWQDLGYFLAPWMAGDAPVPAAGQNALTRVAGLRRDDGHWLAIVLVQVAPAGGAPCPTPTGLHVAEEAGNGSCLRMRGDADFDHWLQQQHSVLYHWLDQRGWTARPRAWIGYRLTTGGSIIETHALVDPNLLEPATRNNVEFLTGGQSARQWARRLAAATRAAAGSGALNVPPFPFAPRVALPPEPVSAPLAAPASAPVSAAEPARAKHK